MKIKKLLALAVTGLSAVAAMADGPYRNHVYDSFMGTPPAAEEGTQIVFLGNSITNMHNWSEAFGSDVNVVNRGNSGGYAYEWIEQIEAITDSKPAKVFIGIGTNDNSENTSIERAHQTAMNICLIVERIHIASPDTKVYVQSILPRIANPQFERNTLTNSLVAEKAEKYDFTFIDLTETMMGMRTTTGTNAATTWAPDGLHPSGRGYAAWCHAIKDYVNGQCSYPEDINYHPLLTNLYNPSRVSQFSLLPLDSDDVVFLGDEMIENGKWTELLGTEIKTRSNGYGYGGMGIAGDGNNMRDAVGMLRASIESNPATQHAPKKLFIYSGVNEATNTNITTEVFTDRWNTLLSYIKEKCPQTKVYLMSILKHASHTARIEELNNIIKGLCDADESLTYIDIYTPLNEAAATPYLSQNYVYGRGYVKIAQILAPYLAEEGAKAPTEAEFEEYYAARQARKQLGLQYNRVFTTLYDESNFGVEIGKISPTLKGSLKQLKKAIAARMGEGSTPTAEEIAAFKADVDELLLQTPQFTSGEYYRLTSRRGAKSAAANAAGNAMIGHAANAASSDGSDIWTFEQRADGNYNIKNFNGAYIDVTAAFNSAMTLSTVEPAFGWQIGQSTSYPGAVTIYATDGTEAKRVQLNQTSDDDVYNWFGTFPDPEDQGCAYNITKFTGTLTGTVTTDTPEDEVPDPSQFVTIKLVSNTYNNIANRWVMTNPDPATHTNGLYDLIYEETVPDASPAQGYFLASPGAADGQWILHQPNGRSSAADGRAQNADASIPVTANGQNYTIAHWVPFAKGGMYMAGKSGSNTGVYEVKLADMSQYDVWHVSITGTGEVATATNATTATNMKGNLSVTYTSENNKSIPTVHNGGFYIVKKGTVPTAEELSFGGARMSSQTQQTPDVNIDPVSRTIYVNFNAGPAAGWRTITLHSVKTNGNRAYVTEWTDKAKTDNADRLQSIEEECEQAIGSNKIYYATAIHTENAEKPAAHLFYIAPGTTAATTSLLNNNGHYIKTDGTADRAAQNHTFLAHESEAGVYSAELAIFGTTAATGASATATSAAGSDKPLLGKFSGAHSYFKFESSPERYEAYTVKLVNCADAANIKADTRITVTHAQNKGLAKVYNGGTIFLAEGSELTADDIQAPTLNGNAPKITVANGVVKVDYTIPVLTITFDKSEISLQAGQSEKITADTDTEATPALIWTTSNSDVATVSVAGLVRAIAPGTATITASYGATTASCEVTVTAAVAESITLSSDNETLNAGESVVLVPSVAPAYVLDQLPIYWMSSNTAIATVDDGLVTAIAPGTATITATCGDKTATCTITVAGEQDGIMEVCTTRQDANSIYDLQGRRLNAPIRGINIINGQKVLIR